MFPSDTIRENYKKAVIARNATLEKIRQLESPHRPKEESGVPTRGIARILRQELDEHEIGLPYVVKVLALTAEDIKSVDDEIKREATSPPTRVRATSLATPVGTGFCGI